MRPATCFPGSGPSRPVLLPHPDRGRHATYPLHLAELLDAAAGLPGQFGAQQVQPHRSQVQGAVVELLEVERGTVATAGQLPRLQSHLSPSL